MYSMHHRCWHVISLHASSETFASTSVRFLSVDFSSAQLRDRWAGRSSGEIDKWRGTNFVGGHDVRLMTDSGCSMIGRSIIMSSCNGTQQVAETDSCSLMSPEPSDGNVTTLLHRREYEQVLRYLLLPATQ